MEFYWWNSFSTFHCHFMTNRGSLLRSLNSLSSLRYYKNVMWDTVKIHPNTTNIMMMFLLSNSTLWRPGAKWCQSAVLMGGSIKLHQWFVLCHILECSQYKSVKMIPLNLLFFNFQRIAAGFWGLWRVEVGSLHRFMSSLTNKCKHKYYTLRVIY